MKGDPIFVFIICIHIFSFEWIVIHEWVIFVIPFYWWVHLSGSYPHSGLLYFNSFSLEIARIKLQSLHNFYSPINSCLQKVADIAQKMFKSYTYTHVVGRPTPSSYCTVFVVNGRHDFRYSSGFPKATWWPQASSKKFYMRMLKKRWRWQGNGSPLSKLLCYEGY